MPALEGAALAEHQAMGAPSSSRDRFTRAPARRKGSCGLYSFRARHVKLGQILDVARAEHFQIWLEIGGPDRAIIGPSDLFSFRFVGSKPMQTNSGAIFGQYPLFKRAVDQKSILPKLASSRSGGCKEAGILDLFSEICVVVQLLPKLC